MTEGALHRGACRDRERGGGRKETRRRGGGRERECVNERCGESEKKGEE